MTVLLDIKFEQIFGQVAAFETTMPDRSITQWADLKNSQDDFARVRYAVVWNPDPGMLSSLPSLEVIFSAGAGVDHIFCDTDLPQHLPIIRFVDPDLTNRMSEWVVLQCLMHLRQQRQYDLLQRNHQWRELPQPIASEVRVGIMGLGKLGLDAARKLMAMGFQVQGWSRRQKTHEGISCFAGEEGFVPFLNQTDILVCLLPLTPQTRGIIDVKLVDQLGNDGVIRPVIINAGRGGCHDEAALVEALKDGRLGGISLDVFEKEPLAANSPLWDFNNAILTPHVAATSDILALARYVAGQIKQHELGRGRDNQVDLETGY